MGNIYHQWNGTVLTITSDSGTSSADLRGEKGDTGIRGAQGIQGEKGEQGTYQHVYYSPVNLLDNSNFQIWQRGELIENVLTVTYGADRWNGSGNLYRDYQKINNGIRITARTAGKFLGLQQRIPAEKLKNGEYTLVWSYKPSQACTTYNGKRTAANVNEKEIKQITVSTDDITNGYKKIEIGIMNMSDGSDIPQGFYFDVEYVALYEGVYTAETIPAYQYKGYAAELAECQRYYSGVINFITTKMANLSLEETFILSVPMRINNPTAVTIMSNNNTEDKVSYFNNNEWVDTDAHISTLDAKSVRVSVYNIDINTTIQGKFIISADL